MLKSNWLDHGRRKSMKTPGFKFCYKKRSDYSREQVNIHINTSSKTSTVEIAILDLVWRETLKFKMLYLKDSDCFRAKNLQMISY